METRLVRTKTGNKIHRSSRGASRTWCGYRVAMVLKHISANAEGCGGCGFDPTLSAGEIAEFHGLQVKG